LKGVTRPMMCSGRWTVQKLTSNRFQNVIKQKKTQSTPSTVAETRKTSRGEVRVTAAIAVLVESRSKISKQISSPQRRQRVARNKLHVGSASAISVQDNRKRLAIST